MITVKLGFIHLGRSDIWNYGRLPASLDVDFLSYYDFIYPLSYRLALDCERIVYKLMEMNIELDVCRILYIVFAETEGFRQSELIDYAPFMDAFASASRVM